MVVMNVFKHAQPALLYLVPSCLLLPLLVAAIKGDVKELINYEDEEAKEENNAAEEKKDNWWCLSKLNYESKFSKK